MSYGAKRHNSLPECHPERSEGSLKEQLIMDTFTRISVQKAREIMGSPDVAIVDIRDPGSFAQGHIDRALNLNDENIKDFLQVTDKKTPLVCYCYHGISSQRAADFFTHQGFKQVYSIDGGWEAWKTAYA